MVAMNEYEWNIWHNVCKDDISNPYKTLLQA